MNPFRRRENNKPVQQTNKGSTAEERATYSHIEKTSDWVLRIRELRALEVLNFFKDATDPARTYMLYVDGGYQGSYNSSRALNPTSVVAGAYLVYELLNQRRALSYHFDNVPVSDRPDITTSVDVDLMIDIEYPDRLVTKGVWHIGDTVKLTVQRQVNSISRMHKALNAGDCESQLSMVLSSEEFDFGIRIVNCHVKRAIPAAFLERLRLDDEKRLSEEKRLEEQRLHVEQLRKTDADQQRTWQLEDAQNARIAGRQTEYLEVYKRDGIPGLELRAVAEKDPQLKTEIRQFIESMERREQNTYERSKEQEDRGMSFEERAARLRLEVSKEFHNQQMEKLQLMENAGLLKADIMFDDPGSRQVINESLSDVFRSNRMEDVTGPELSRPPSAERRALPGRGPAKQIDSGARRRTDDEDDEVEDACEIADKAPGYDDATDEDTQ